MEIALHTYDIHLGTRNSEQTTTKFWKVTFIKFLQFQSVFLTIIAKKLDLGNSILTKENSWWKNGIGNSRNQSSANLIFVLLWLWSCSLMAPRANMDQWQKGATWEQLGSLKVRPFCIDAPYIWALPVWVGGSKRLPRWFGTLISKEENCPSSNGHILVFGGV